MSGLGEYPNPINFKGHHTWPTEFRVSMRRTRRRIAGWVIAPAWPPYRRVTVYLPSLHEVFPRRTYRGIMKALIHENLMEYVCMEREGEGPRHCHQRPCSARWIATRMLGFKP
jgi:hypothetical protein